MLKCNGDSRRTHKVDGMKKRIYLYEKNYQEKKGNVIKVRLKTEQQPLSRNKNCSPLLLT